MILNGSIASIKGFEAFSVYDATKAAVRSFARSWIIDLKGRGVRVNVLSPGHIDTPGLSALMTDQQKAAALANVPLGRLGTPDDMGKVAVFLASDDSGYVNLVLQKLHLVSSPVLWLEGRDLTVVLGLVYGYIPYMILPFYGFLDRIEASLLEAGRDLGASPASTFWRVTLPLAKPAVAALAVLAFMDQWRNVLWPLVVTSSANMEVAEVALAHFHTAYAGNWPYQMAAAVLVTLPVLLVCLRAQRHVMHGVRFTGARVRL